MKHKPTHPVKFVTLGLGIAVLSAAYSQAASIIWQTPVTITDEADLDANFNLGYTTVVQAFKSGGQPSVVTPTQTINFTQGAFVQGDPPPAGSNFTTYVQNTAFGAFDSNAGLFNAAGTTVGADFESILDVQTFSFGATGFIQFRLNQLNVGQQYALQLFVSDDRGSSATRGGAFQDTVDGSGNNSATFLFSSSPYVIGTFTADATTQYFRELATGGDASMVGYVLSTVPEPSSYAMFSLGACMFCFNRRVRRVARH